MAAQLSREMILDRLPIAISGITHVTEGERASATYSCKNL